MGQRTSPWYPNEITADNSRGDTKMKERGVSSDSQLGG